MTLIFTDVLASTPILKSNADQVDQSNQCSIHMLRYKEFEHTADVGVEIYGSTLEDLFKNAGYAFFNTIVDATTINSNITRSVNVTSPDLEALLMNWLRELLFLFSVHQEVYGEFEFQSAQITYLEAMVKGESLDLERHHFHTEIKAITYHQFTVVNENGIWKARVIFDV